MLPEEAAPGEDEDPGVDHDDAFNLKLLEAAALKSINPTQQITDLRWGQLKPLLQMAQSMVGTVA